MLKLKLNKWNNKYSKTEIFKLGINTKNERLSKQETFRLKINTWSKNTPKKNFRLILTGMKIFLKRSTSLKDK